MSDPAFRVDIDRIVLTGLDVTPDRAEHIRALLEAGLRRQLQREGAPQGMAGGEVSRLHTPEMHLAEPHRDNSVADALAANISHVLRNADPAARR